MENRKSWRVGVLEDDEYVVVNLLNIITSSTEFDLVGVAGRISDFPTLLDASPDLFLLDIGLPDGSGLDVVSEIKQLTQAKILILTNFGDQETVVSALHAGADGYLLKDSSSAIIKDGMKVTLEGGAPISSSAAVFLLDFLRRTSNPLGYQKKPDEALTKREIEVLEVFAKGATYKQAARALGISPLTIGSHVKSIYRKLEVNSSGEAVYAAISTGQLIM